MFGFEGGGGHTCVGVHHVRKASLPALLFHLFPPCWPSSRARVEHDIQVKDGNCLTHLQLALARPEAATVLEAKCRVVNSLSNWLCLRQIPTITVVLLACVGLQTLAQGEVHTSVSSLHDMQRASQLITHQMLFDCIYFGHVQMC